MAKASSVPDYNQDFPDMGTKILETWGREGNLAREMANRLLLASGNISEARRKDATDFEQAKALAELKQKYAQQNIAARARAGSSDASLDGEGNLLLSGSEALQFQLAGRGEIVGPGVDNKGKPKVKVRPLRTGETIAPPATGPQSARGSYVANGSAIPAPAIVPSPAPVGGPPAAAGLRTVALPSGKTVVVGPDGKVVNGTQ